MSHTRTPFADPAVESAFEAFPASQKDRLLELRGLILDVADRQRDVIGEVEESLKWGEPSYRPVRARIGSPVRMGSFDANQLALYFNCQTMLVERIRGRYRDALAYSKNRAVLFDAGESLPAEAIRECVRMALRYHLDKTRVSSRLDRGRE